MNLDPEILAGIKTALRKNPQGMGLTELAGLRDIARESLSAHLDHLARTGEVAAKLHGQSAVYTLGEALLGPPLLRYSAEMIVLLDDQRRIIQTNEAFRVFCCGDADARAGGTPAGMAAELMAELPLDDYFTHPAGQSPRHFIRFLQHEGKDRFFQIRVAPWPFEDGAWGVVLLIEDSTPRRSAELALAECQHSYREVFRNIQDVFYRSDARGNLQIASDSLARLLGYDSVDECLGRNAAQTFYLHPEDRDEMMAQLRKEGSVWDYEVMLKKKDGTPVPVSMNSHLIYSPDGVELGVEGIFRDVSERTASREFIHQHLEKIVGLSRELLEAVDRPPRRTRG